jgi:hypothetical protein
MLLCISENLICLLSNFTGTSKAKLEEKNSSKSDLSTVHKAKTKPKLDFFNEFAPQVERAQSMTLK